MHISRDVLSTNCSKSDIPCALQHYVSKTQRKMEKLSPLECQTAFQHWAAYHRINSSYISPPERFACPLTCCDASYDDLTSALNHIAGCPRLDAAEYWCPRCRRPERFLAYDASLRSYEQIGLNRTGSKLKRAVVFFRQFSLKGCSRSCSHKSPSPRAGHRRQRESTIGDCQTQTNNESAVSYLEHLNDPYGINTKSELDTRPPAGRLFVKAELPANAMGSTLGWDKISASEPQELAAVDVSIPSRGSLFSAGYSTALTRYGPEDYDAVSHYDVGHDNIAESIRRGSRRRSGQELPMSPMSQECWQPPVPIDSADNSSVELESPSTAGVAAFNDDKFFELAADASTSPRHDQRSSSFTESNHGNDINRVSTTCLPTQIQVEELYHLFNALHDEWMQRISKVPGLLDHWPDMPIVAMFEWGLQAWQDIIRGKPPKTAEVGLAMMQIAVACAFVLQDDREMASWHALQHGILQWRHVISDLTERRLFARVIVQVLGCPQDTLNVHFFLQGSLCGKTSSKAVQGPSVSRRLIGNSNILTTYAKSDEKTAGTTTTDDDLLSTLKEGKPMDAILRYLDDVAYAGVQEREVQYQATASWWVLQHPGSMHDMIRLIVQPLGQCPEMEVFWSVCDEVANKIRAGLRRNPREVEVTLLYMCKSIPGDPSTHESIRGVITRVCDSFMAGKGAAWRDRHYATEVDRFVSLTCKSSAALRSVRLPTYEDAIASKPSNPAPAYSPLSRQLPTSPAILKTPKRSFDDMSPLPGATVSTLNSRKYTKIYSNPEATTTPKNLFNNSLPTPPSSQASPTSGDGTIRCPTCDSPFTSTTNRERHIRNIHHPKDRLPCPKPKCLSTFSRPDNVNKHLRDFHREILVMRRGAVKKRKTSSGHGTPPETS